MIAHSLHAITQASMHTRCASRLARFDERVKRIDPAAWAVSCGTHQLYSPLQRGCHGDEGALARVVGDPDVLQSRLRQKRPRQVQRCTSTPLMPIYEAKMMIPPLKDVRACVGVLATQSDPR